MPQIQVLPGVPSFGGQLGQALGGGLSQGLNAGLQQMLEQKAQQQKVQQLMQALGLGGGEQEEPQQGAVPGIPPGGQMKSSQNSLNLTPEKVLAATIANPAIGGALSNLYKTQEKKGELTQSREVAQDSLNRMSEILSRGNLGLTSKARGALGGKTSEDIGEFESLGGALESLLKDQVSKGTLSNARFEYITKTLLPKATDNEARIRGKLRGLARELKLAAPEFLSEKHLDKDTAAKILEQAKGDVTKARKIAKAKGYEF